MKGFKRCEKGHMFKDNLAECPYCPKGSNVSNNDKTEVAGGQSFGDKTEIFVDSTPAPAPASKSTPSNPPTQKTEVDDLNKTFIQGADSDQENTPKPRSTRKLMGWIVTFTNHPMGIDFKIYEGRNFIGTGTESDIKIYGDQSISGKHALILCRKNKFWLSDQLSSNGTFLNGESFNRITFPKEFVLIFGNESNGISKSVSKFLSYKITIPKVSKSNVDSLNITCATAIIMNEISNQSFKS